MSLTKNRLLEMMSAVRLMEREIKALNELNTLGMNPTTHDKMEIGINYMQHQVSFLRACIESELYLIENK